jgi:hypothetical protein
MELFTLAALGTGGYLLYKHFKKETPGAKVNDFQSIKGSVTGRSWAVRTTKVDGSGETKKTTVEVWAPAGSWGPHTDLLVTTYQQTGSNMNSRVSLGTGPNALPEMVTAVGQDFNVKKPTTTVSGAPDHVVPLIVSGRRVGHVEVSHGGDHYDWNATVNGSVVSGVAPTPAAAVGRALAIGNRRS